MNTILPSLTSATCEYPAVGLTMVSGLKIFTCGASGPCFGSLLLAAFASWADKTGPQPSTTANATQLLQLMIRSSPDAKYRTAHYSRCKRRHAVSSMETTQKI